MKVCVVGSGGREHALAHVLARTAEVVVAPGQIIMQAARYAITEALLHSISDTQRDASGN